MPRYDWPGDRDPNRRDRARFRHEFLFERLLGVPGAILAEASAQRSALLAAQAAQADQNVWLPIGPSVTLDGQGGSRPRVTGRVRDLAVSTDGRRIYAASANGGVWYSSDAGNSWSPIGAAGSTPAGEAAAPGPSSLVTSCLWVKFGDDPDGSQDIVYAGTGEIRTFIPGRPGGWASGIGVLKLSRPLPQVLSDPSVNPWKREAPNLAGAGIFRIARDPLNPDPDDDTLIAATSIGLFRRDDGFQENREWTRVTTGPFDFDADDGKWCTDVIWAEAKDTTPPRLWVALIDTTLFSDTGIWVSEGGVNGPYEKVDLSDVDTDGRLGIAVHENNPSIAYVLGKGPRLWRIDGKTARQVRNLPRKLFGQNAQKDQSHYDLAVAVHPTDPNQVIIGGSTVKSELFRQPDGTVTGGEWSASLFRLTITGTAAADNFFCNFNQDNQDEPSFDTNTYIGSNVHADIHCVRYRGMPHGSQVWVGCDGGVFRSLQGGDAYTFVPRSTGMSVIEAGYVGCHPTRDGVVIIGTQDNGALIRVGDTIWNRWISLGGDGGGVAFHPAVPTSYVGQYTYAVWQVNAGGWVNPVYRQGSSEESKSTENKDAAFYSDLHVIPGAAATPNRARVALGTSRVWISEDWNPRPGAAPMTWATLPSDNDPRLNGGNNTSNDTFKDFVGQVQVVQWAGPLGFPQNRILALCQRAVLVFTRDQGTGRWTRDVISYYNEKCGDDEIDNDEIGQPTSSILPPRGAWSDLAIHDTFRGTHGSFYVATTGYATFDDDELEVADRMDTLWWFDGVDTWHPTALRGHVNATRAPAFTVVTDPDDISVVYVGTSAGVWKGDLTFTNGIPEWDWHIFSNGLPDAIVQDLAFFRNGDLKLLRAALQARGVWEVDLSATPSPPRRTYLRAQPFDTRRRFPANLDDPRALPPSQFNWHDSPDIRFRPAPGTLAPLGLPISLSANPWTRSTFGDPYDLWVFQTAMHAFDPLVRPTGQWTQQFDARIRAYRRANSIPTTGIVNLSAYTQAGVASFNLVVNGVVRRVSINNGDDLSAIVADINGTAGLGPTGSLTASDDGAGHLVLTPNNASVRFIITANATTAALGLTVDAVTNRTSDTPVVDADLWDRIVVHGAPYATPWDGSEPSEADLHELVRDRTLNVAGTDALRVSSLRYQIDVLVHHRHFQPIDALNVRVIMLRRNIPAADNDGASIVLSPDWKTAVVQRLGGAGTPLPDGWELVGIRNPISPVSARMPRAVTFDIDLIPDPPFALGSHWVFLAVATSTTDAVSEASLAGNVAAPAGSPPGSVTIRDLVLNSHHVAARFVHVSA